MTATQDQAVQDLWHEFHADDVDEAELGHVLGSYFGSGQQSDSQRITLPRGDSYSVALRFQRGDLVAIEPGALLTPTQVKDLRELIEQNLLTSAGTRVWRTIRFGDMPISGWWRYNDRFQILEVPPHAPKPRDLSARQPFILEVAYRQSPDREVEMLRHIASANEVADLLSVLLESSLHSREHGRVWVMVNDDPNDVKDSQHWYEITGHQHESDSMSDPGSSSPVVQIDAQAYYESWGTPIGSMRVPTSLESSLDSYFALGSQDRSAFRRAAHWFREATSRRSSRSAALTDVVASIEALQPHAVLERCPECQSVRHVTRRFKAFLDEYAPTETSKPDQARLELYDLRSRLSHGDLLLRTDLEHAWVRLHPTASHHDSVVTEAFAIARIAFVNRLHRAADPTAPNLVSHRPFVGRRFFVKTPIGTTPTKIFP